MLPLPVKFVLFEQLALCPTVLFVTVVVPVSPDTVRLLMIVLFVIDVDVMVPWTVTLPPMVAWFTLTTLAPLVVRLPLILAVVLA